MNIDLQNKNLTTYEREEIQKLLLRKKKNITDDLEQMWYLMDLVWDDYSCDNKNLNWDAIGKFYAHPVWLLNGLFIEQDDVSMGHREAISRWIVEKGFERIVDYGGGFGTLARLIAEKNQHISIDIYEPHPSEYGLKQISEYPNIEMIRSLDTEVYDCLLSTDVLEHVADPLQDFSMMISSVKTGGYLVIANAFYPMIKCHLPQNFHFRYSFNIFAKMMGLSVIGRLDGSHATIFQKRDHIGFDWQRLRKIEMISKKIFPVLEVLKPVLRLLRGMTSK